MKIVRSAAFDIIAMKSVLGGIGSWSGVLGQHQALDNILRALVPGGELWQIFIRDPNGVMIELNYEATKEKL